MIPILKLPIETTLVSVIEGASSKSPLVKWQFDFADPNEYSQSIVSAFPALPGQMTC